MSSSTPSRLTLVLVVSLALVAAVAVALGVVGVARAGSISVLPVPQTAQQVGITVCGEGKATTTPDQAQIDAGVQASAPRAADARTQAAKAMNAVLAALKANGVGDQDIQTTYFSIEPQYSYDNGPPQQTGYSVTNTVTATIRNVSSVGNVVDAVTQAGGDNVQIDNIAFSRGDPSQAQAEAQQNALADAHAQAQRIASAAGASLGAPLSIQVGSCGQQVQPYNGQYAAASAAGPSTPIQPGQQQVTVNVQVVYALR
jgi:uncharacterized protein YggE